MKNEINSPTVTDPAPTGKHKPIPPLDERAKTRFWSFVDKRGPDECWPWIGFTTHYNRGGMRFGRYKPGNIAAPRIAWAVANGNDPGDLLVCHTCDNPNCVNPGHLWLGTNADNTRDMFAKGRDQHTRRSSK